MSTISGGATQRAGTGAVAHALGSVLLRWWVAYTAWRIERLAISSLEAMSDRQLKDIGIVRSQIAFAVKGRRERAAIWTL